MTKELDIHNETTLPPLSAKLAQTLMAMLSTNTDEEAIALSPYARSTFYKLKPKLIKYKELYLNQAVGKSLDMLKALSPKSVEVLGEQLNEKRNQQIRNKAANDILDRALPKNDKPNTVIGIQGNDMSIKFVGDE